MTQAGLPFAEYGGQKGVSERRGAKIRERGEATACTRALVVLLTSVIKDPTTWTWRRLLIVRHRTRLFCHWILLRSDLSCSVSRCDIVVFGLFLVSIFCMRWPKSFPLTVPAVAWALLARLSPVQFLVPTLLLLFYSDFIALTLLRRRFPGQGRRTSCRHFCDRAYAGLWIPRRATSPYSHRSGTTQVIFRRNSEFLVQMFRRADSTVKYRLSGRLLEGGHESYRGGPVSSVLVLPKKHPQTIFVGPPLYISPV